MATALVLNDPRLRRLAYGGFLSTAGSKPISFFSFVTNDLLSEVIAASYFNLDYARLAVGDMIFASIDQDGTPDFAELRVTAISGAGAVTVATEASGNNVAGVAASYKIARGQATTVAASDTIVTGLATVVAAIAVLDDAPVAGCQFAQASIGDQAGAPAAGSILLKTWKATATADTAQIAATTFGKKVNWIAIGT